MNFSGARVGSFVRITRLYVKGHGYIDEVVWALVTGVYTHSCYIEVFKGPCIAWNEDELDEGDVARFMKPSTAALVAYTRWQLTGDKTQQ
jgi:hypothetical protein